MLAAQPDGRGPWHVEPEHRPSAAVGIHLQGPRVNAGLFSELARRALLDALSRLAAAAGQDPQPPALIGLRISWP